MAAGEVTDQWQLGRLQTNGSWGGYRPMAAGEVTDQWQLGRLQTNGSWGGYRPMAAGEVTDQWQLGRLQKLNGSWESYRLQYQLERAAGKVIRFYSS